VKFRRRPAKPQAANLGTSNGVQTVGRMARPSQTPEERIWPRDDPLAVADSGRAVYPQVANRNARR